MVATMTELSSWLCTSLTPHGRNGPAQNAGLGGAHAGLQLPGVRLVVASGLLYTAGAIVYTHVHAREGRSDETSARGSPCSDLPLGTGETVSGDPRDPHSCGSRIASCATWLRRTHRGDSILVDLDYVASGVCSAREAFEACRSPRNDRMGVGAGLDHVTLFNLLVEERGQTIAASP